MESNAHSPSQQIEEIDVDRFITNQEEKNEETEEQKLDEVIDWDMMK